MLIMVVPYQTSPQRQRMQIYLWTAVIMIMYSVLVSLFKIKNGGTFILLVYCVCITDYERQGTLSDFFCNRTINVHAFNI